MMKEIQLKKDKKLQISAHKQNTLKTATAETSISPPLYSLCCCSLVPPQNPSSVHATIIQLPCNTPLSLVGIVDYYVQRRLNELI
jgi:hypothetical protein